VGPGKTIPTTITNISELPVMRTRQTPAPEVEGEVTLQQVMETMCTLQRENEESRRQVEEFQAAQELLREESALEQKRLRDEAEVSR